MADSNFKNALVVEDDKGHFQLIKRSLKNLTEEITHCTSIAEANEKLKDRDFDVVLLDLGLPDGNGLDLLSPLTESQPDLPVVVMTSSSELTDVVSAMSSGAWDYIVKDFDDHYSDRLTICFDQISSRRADKARELELEAERNAFSKASRTAQDGLAIVNQDGKVAFSNDAFAVFVSHFGCENCRNLLEMLQGFDEQFCNEFKSHLESADGDTLFSSDLQIPVEFEDGQRVKHYSLNLSSTSASEGPDANDRQCIVWVRDITKAKEREKFQRDLLSTTTHDLKGPIGAIMTAADLLEDADQLEPEQVQGLVVRIGSCARNCISLVDEFLNARRIQDGVLVVKPVFTSLKELIEDSYLDFQPVARSKGIELFCSPVSEEVMVYADHLAIMRVVNNFVSNALKFTQSGGKVSIVAERIGKEVRISVSDTGNGIPAERLHNLFERYSRLEQHQQVEGTGLGLYVAKNIVDSHSGKLEVSSVVGVGTKFSIFLFDPDAEEIEREKTRDKMHSEFSE